MNNSDEIDLMQLVNKLIDNYKIILAFTGAFAVLSLIYLRFATPIYKADALVQVESKKGGTAALLGDMSNIFEKDSPASQEIEIIKSRMVLGKTIDNLHLDLVIRPKYFPIFGRIWQKLKSTPPPSLEINHFTVPEEFYNQPFLIKIDDAKKGTYTLFSPENESVLHGQIGKTTKTQDFSINIKSFDADSNQKFKVKKLAFLTAFQGLSQNLNVAEKSRQTGILEISLKGPQRKEIENILNNITQNYFLQNVARNSEEAEKSLVFLEKHLPDVKEQLNIAEEELNQYRQKNESVDLNLEAETALNAIIKIETQLNELKFKESELSKRFTKEHPAYIALLDNRATLMDEKERLNKAIQKFPSTQREILRMRRDAKVSQQLYIALLNKMQELNITKAGTIGNVRIIDTAIAGLKPVAPKSQLVFILATLLGLISGIVFVIIRQAIFSSIETPEQVEAIGLPVFSSIPLSDKQSNHSTLLLAKNYPEDLSIESIRSLRTNLHFSSIKSDKNNNVITITGPSPGVGKSFVSSNLATVIAQSNKKVLLIDADMRKGTLHKIMSTDNQKGLSDYLANEKSLDEIINQTFIKDFDFISKGNTPPNPAELLMQEGFTKLVDWAKTQYDWVIIDTPPILAVTDAAIASSLSGITLLVGSQDKTRIKEIELSCKRLERSDTKISGFVFNMMQKKASGYYYNNYYYYDYKKES